MRIVKYKWSLSGRAEPFLVSDSQQKISLLNKDIGMKIGGKHCIGYFAGSSYFPCPHDKEIETGWNCNECRLRDDFFMCIKCTGDDCMNQKQRPSCEESVYFIYLAAFNGLIKVGISHERRLLERLIEQGADFGAKVALVRDGKDVRTIEQSIRKELNIVDLVRGHEKQKMLFGNPNKCVVNIFSSIQALRTNGFSKHLVPPEIYDLRDYYNLSAVEYNPDPVKVETGSEISGRVVAAKGPVLVIRDGAKLFSINAHDLIGRDIVLQPSIAT